MTALPTHSLQAVNTATDSPNRIHDDEVARRYGFSGGLVPGVDVFAWLCHPPVAAWGRDWLGGGTLQARFLHPVYDGEQVAVGPPSQIGHHPGAEVPLEVRNHAGLVCATAVAARSAPPPPDVSGWVAPPVPVDPPRASEQSLAAGTVLGAFEVTYRAELSGPYLDALGEGLPVFRDEGVAHPGFLLRTANWLLAANVVLGPWIHVESQVALHGIVADGAQLSTRGQVLDRYERKGHRFVVLDVLVVADERPALRARHTAIYEPRPAT